VPRLTIIAIAAVTLAFTGCRSPYVATTVSNHTASPLALIEVDYPSASFGTQTLVPGANFNYRFKVLGAGFMKVTWTDSNRKELSSKGPYLKEGAEGPVTITIAPDGAHWQTTLGSTPPPE
jgi:hypothetical protein